ncbi:hypothetical protein SKAU_G00356570 [Synaphobranchus kaupii]|uniref:Uncharacterized protein n=1 Tax=Synaphobranchus kaupii TaxID=118154 RepID=A0A9Q1EHF9_SYNKA|nr:hypothetical protein SKAU_G00356570 [Synaphobranchus kaupii]
MFRPRGVSLSLGREAWQTSGRGSARTPAELEDLGSPERRLVSAAGKLDANEPSRRRESFTRGTKKRAEGLILDAIRGDPLRLTGGMAKRGAARVGERRCQGASGLDGPNPTLPQPAHVLRKRWPPASKGHHKARPVFSSRSPPGHLNKDAALTGKNHTMNERLSPRAIPGTRLAPRQKRRATEHNSRRPSGPLCVPSAATRRRPPAARDKGHPASSP